MRDTAVGLLALGVLVALVLFAAPLCVPFAAWDRWFYRGHCPWLEVR